MVTSTESSPRRSDKIRVNAASLSCSVMATLLRSPSGPILTPSGELVHTINGQRINFHGLSAVPYAPFRLMPHDPVRGHRNQRQTLGIACASRPPMRTGSIRRARPVVSSVSTKTPQMVTGPSAGPSFSPGILRQKRSVAPSFTMPITLS